MAAVLATFGVAAAAALRAGTPTRAVQPLLTQQLTFVSALRAGTMVADRSGDCVVLVDQAARVHFLYSTQRRVTVQTCRLPAAVAAAPSAVLAAEPVSDEALARVVVSGWGLEPCPSPSPEAPWTAQHAVVFRRTATGFVAGGPLPERLRTCAGTECSTLSRGQEVYELHLEPGRETTEVRLAGRLVQVIEGVPLAAGDLDHDGSEELLTASLQPGDEGDGEYDGRLFRWTRAGLGEVWRTTLGPLVWNGGMAPAPLAFFSDLDHDGGDELLVIDGAPGIVSIYRG